MHSILPILIALIALAHPAQAAPSLNEQYASCTKTVKSNPEDTYKRARAWYGQSRSLASQHCMALALYELKDYDGAASTLETILKGITPQQGRLWLTMKAQAAKAYYATGNHTAAVEHLTDGLYWAMDKGMDVDMVPLLLQRAKIYVFHDQHLQAVQDLDHALSIRPTTQIRLQRADLLLKMGKNAQAIDDIELVLQEEPRNKDALTLRALAGTE